MNWARGLFRLWIAFAICWVILSMLFTGYPALIVRALTYQEDPEYQEAVKNWDKPSPYDTPGARRLPPEEWPEWMKPEPRPTAEQIVKRTIGTAMLGSIPPLVILGFGSLLVWAIRGFTRSQTAR